jgi:hypothetical protein
VRERERDEIKKRAAEILYTRKSEMRAKKRLPFTTIMRMKERGEEGKQNKGV